MKSIFPVTLIVCMAAFGLPLKAQAQSKTARFAEGRRVIRSAGGHVEEVAGLLASDVQTREIRFDVESRAAFAVPYSRITSLHYERSVDPSKWGWPMKDTNHYLTVHYMDAAGHATVETVRLSERDVTRTLEALETDTGLKIDRSAAKQSFQGIPIRAAIGDRVAVTDRSGRAVEGMIAQLSPSSLELYGPGATPWVFNAATTTRIRRSRSKPRDAFVGFLIGAIAGGAAGGLAGAGIGGNARAAFAGASVLGGFLGGLGAAMYAASPSYHQRATRDIYVNTP
jgi:hypothetical protein